MPQMNKSIALMIKVKGVKTIQVKLRIAPKKLFFRIKSCCMKKFKQFKLRPPTETVRKIVMKSI